MDFLVGVAARLAPPRVRASPKALPSQRGSSVLSPSLTLVTVAHRSTWKFLLYVVDCWERG